MSQFKEYMESINTNKPIDLGLPILNKIKTKLEKESSIIYDKIKKMVKILSDRANENNISINKISLIKFNPKKLCEFLITFDNGLPYKRIDQIAKDFTKDGKSMSYKNTVSGNKIMTIQIDLELI